jgi:threonine dehydrogenase-like Zn-dependent dehydrogenase
MRAAIYYGPGDVRAGEVPEPELAPGSLLIRVESCGICGSDLHAYRTGLLEQTAYAVDGGGRVFGHEIAGVVEQVGHGVEGFGIGDRVAGVAFGGFAERIVMPVTPRSPSRIPDEMTFDAGATLEPLAVAIHGAKLAEVQAGQLVVILGAGTIGVSVLQYLKATRDCEVVVVDAGGPRLDLAARVGADRVIDFTTTDTVAELSRIYAERLPEAHSWVPSASGPVDAVFDCAGARVSADQAIRMLRSGSGRLVMLALYENEPAWDANAFVLKGLSAVGSFSWTAEDFDDGLALVTAGRIERDPLVSHRFPLEESGEAFRQGVLPQSTRVIIRPHA